MVTKSIRSIDDDTHTVATTIAEETIRVSSDKTERLIAWNVDLLKRSLQQIVAHRKGFIPTGKNTSEDIILHQQDRTVFDEVCEIIEMPTFYSLKLIKQAESDSIGLPDIVMEQLEKYITFLADSYQSNVRQHCAVRINSSWTLPSMKCL